MRVMTEGRSSLLGFRTLYEKRREQRDGPTGRSFFLARFPRRPGDVEMGPVVLARESGKETGGGNTAGGTSADICKIGELAFPPFPNIIPTPPPPTPLPPLPPPPLP